MNSLIVVPTRIWEYCIAAMIIILAPGPSVLFVIARAIAWGRATAVATVAGNVTGAFSLSVVVAVGLGPILQRSEIAFISVQVLGGLYLVYLGVTAIKHSQIHASEAGSITSQLILMGAIFAFLGFFSDSGWGILAGTIRNWLATELKRLVIMRMTGGIVMVILGLLTLLSAIRSR
jgi:threonine/homoserine/homoserine lactone efflux protein